MKVLAIMGSPRLGGNSDVLLNEAIQGAKAAGATVDKVNLIDLGREMCVACHSCIQKAECVHDKRTNEVLQKIKTAHGLILSTPVWSMSMSSYMKAFMDHWGVFMNPDYTSRIPGKRVGFIAVCASPDRNYSIPAIKHMEECARFFRMRVKGKVAVKGYGAAGEVSKDKKAMAAAFRVGKAVAS